MVEWIKKKFNIVRIPPIFWVLSVPFFIIYGVFLFLVFIRFVFMGFIGFRRCGSCKKYRGIKTEMKDVTPPENELYIIYKCIGCVVADELTN